MTPIDLPMLEAQRPERADAARNRVAILCAAERLIAEQGVRALTMDKVACAAGVGKGTLFRHYGDRSGLLHALLDQRERSFQDDFIRGPGPLGPGGCARERMVAFGEQIIERIESQGDLMAAAMNGDPGLRLRHSVYEIHRVFLVTLLQESSIGDEQDAGYLADVLLGALLPELVLYQLRTLEMTPEYLKRCWGGLVRRIADAPSARSAGVASTVHT